MPNATPVLWQIKISHYNEKARWALDYKRVPHRRRAPMPLFGTLPIAVALTGHTTMPILVIDGEAIGDSTRIIAALERRHPEPPLYPDDPGERARALDLEEHFDEQLAPHARQLVWFETGKDPRTFTDTAMPDSSPLVRAALLPGASMAAALVQRRYGIDEEAAAAAREGVVAAMDRLEAELGADEYLTGGRFTVADLTAAALFTPLICPPERPHPPQAPFPEPLRSFCAELAARPGGEWVHEVYRRHRGGGVPTAPRSR